jgi:hypothetical protein
LFSFLVLLPTNWANHALAAPFNKLTERAASYQSVLLSIPALVAAGIFIASLQRN